MHRLANVELVLGGSMGLASVNVVETKSIIYYKLLVIGHHHIDVAFLITLISTVAVIDGVRRVYVGNRKKKKD